MRASRPGGPEAPDGGAFGAVQRLPGRTRFAERPTRRSGHTRVAWGELLAFGWLETPRLLHAADAPEAGPLIEFPDAPLPPDEFFEVFLARALGDVKLPRRLRGPLGVVLHGRGGGEWSVHLAPGKVHVAAGLVDDVELTWVQTVADWQGALWEGRGGEAGRWARIVFDPVQLVAQAKRRRPSGRGRRDTAERLLRTAGRIEVRITGAPGGDWAVGVQLGTGRVDDEPDARITLSDDDAVALATGALSPMEALLSGRARIEGGGGLLRKLPALARASAGF